MGGYGDYGPPLRLIKGIDAFPAPPPYLEGLPVLNRGPL